MIRNSIVMLAVIVLLAFFPAVWIPSFKSWNTTRFQLEESKMRLQNLKEYRQRLSEVVRELEAQKEKVQKAQDLLPFQPKAPEFLHAVELLAISHNIVLQEISVSEAKVHPSENNVRYIPITVKGTGSYEDVKGFVTSLENLGRLVIVDKVSVSPQERQEEQEEGGLNMEIGLRIFYLKKEE